MPQRHRGPDHELPDRVPPEQLQPSADRPRVAMALFGDLTYDSRVRREARTLAEAGFDVTIVCLAAQERPSDLPTTVKILVQPAPRTAVIPGSANPFFEAQSGRIAALRGRAGWFTAYVRGLRAWGRLAVRTAGPARVWHAHDLTGLAAIVPNLRPDTPVVYDSHELFLETGTALRLPGPARRLLRAYEQRLISRSSAVVTVNQALASVLQRRYRPRKVVVVHNCPHLWEPPVGRPDLLRRAAGIPVEAAVILHHGALSVDRGIEQLMLVLLQPGLEDAHLVLMGSGEKREDYVRASTEARWRDRVHVLDPVPPTELLPWVASADVGAMPLQPSTLNLRLSTPNKLFECLAAGTPVVASDFPGIRSIIVDNPGGPLGAACDPEQIDAIADALRSILLLEPAEMSSLRTRCHRAATERWNWERESEVLVSLHADLAPRGQAASPASGSG